MKVAISQSNYIPWKGYFDQIGLVDQFVIYDCVQYTRRDWRNRNKIKTSNGLKWLTVPVMSKGNYHSRVRDIKIKGKDWKKVHFKSLENSYSKCEYFHEINRILEPIYLNKEHESLSSLNTDIINIICIYLNINTKISHSNEFKTSNDKNQRLIDICLNLEANTYLSGPAAKSYIDSELFRENDIKIEYMNYENYPEYSQKWGDFKHEVSILDLLFNCGKNSRKYMKF